MPLPREEVTPPVTNTNFGNATPSGVFSMLPHEVVRRKSVRIQTQTLQQDEPRSLLARDRRLARHFNWLFDAAIVQAPVEPQRAEPRVAEHADLAGMLDDRDDLRSQP